MKYDRHECVYSSDLPAAMQEKTRPRERGRAVQWSPRLVPQFASDDTKNILRSYAQSSCT